MKKFFAFLMIVAMASTLSATVYNQFFFNRNQFQGYNATEGAYQLTVPFAYEGTISVSGYKANDNDIFTKEGVIDGDADCVVASVRGNIPVFMTICQPCMDCYPCSELLQQKGEGDKPFVYAAVKDESISGYITRWNLYLVNVDSKEKTADIYKFNLLNPQDAGEAKESVFYTGQKRENAYIQIKSDLGNAVMVGKKADYTFRYYNAKLAVANGILNDDAQNWASIEKTLNTAYIKSVASFQGNYCLAQMLDTSLYTAELIGAPDYQLFGFQLCGTVNLNRNTSVTSQLLSDAYGVPAQQGASSSGNWEDCSTPTVDDANYCEVVIKDSKTTDDNFDAWLKETKYKGYDVDIAEGKVDGIVDVLSAILGY